MTCMLLIAVAVRSKSWARRLHDSTVVCASPAVRRLPRRSAPAPRSRISVAPKVFDPLTPIRFHTQAHELVPDVAVVPACPPVWGPWPVGLPQVRRPPPAHPHAHVHVRPRESPHAWCAMLNNTSGPQIIVGRSCAEAVLCGSDVYVGGVAGVPPDLHTGMRVLICTVLGCTKVRGAVLPCQWPCCVPRALTSVPSAAYSWR